MKKSVLALCAVAAMILVSCSQKVGEPQPAGISNAQVDSVSYAIGQQLGLNIAMSNFGELNMTQITKGMLDMMKLSKDELQENGSSFQSESYDVLERFMTLRQEAVAKINEAEAAKFFEENGKAEGVVTTESGLQYKIVREGEGAKPSENAKVTVNYEGTLLDGTVFDSSYEREEPATFGLYQVIRGWAEGIQYIGEGGEILLWIPSDLAYGNNGAGAHIGPGATLKFRVELISVEEPEE